MENDGSDPNCNFIPILIIASSGMPEKISDFSDSMAKNLLLKVLKAVNILVLQLAFLAMKSVKIYKKGTEK